MKIASTTLHRMFTGTALAIVLLLCLDNYIIPAKKVKEVLDYGFTETSRGYKGSRSYQTYFFKTKSQRNYEVPEDFFNMLNLNESFTVDQSVILRQPLRYSWSHDGDIYSINQSAVFSTFACMLLVYILSMSLIILIRSSTIKNEDKRDLYALSTLPLAILVLVMYIL